jgi:peptidoglycan hydrolase-like protein with peptidoglycan-binding domain
VSATQARVTAAEKGVSDAQAAYTSAGQKFCTEAKDNIAAIDRYGKLFDQSGATVGDVKTQGADLAKPSAAAETAGQDLKTAHDNLNKANQELVDAQAALAGAVSSASSPPPTSAPTATSTPPSLPTSSVDRVKKAETDLETASQGITDTTPLVQAQIQYTSAAFALEAAWLSLFNDAGCFTDEQQANATAALLQYTAQLQTALAAAGYYQGDIDGVYGPSTVDGVKALQTAAGLPVTGLVDKATMAALEAAVTSKGGAIAVQTATATAAVQTTLKLAGFWPGAIDGKWTDELTTALMAFQTSISVPPSGVLDLATLAAVQQKTATAGSTTTTTAASSSTTTSTTAATTSTSAATSTTAAN